MLSIVLIEVRKGIKCERKVLRCIVSVTLFSNLDLLAR